MFIFTTPVLIRHLWQLKSYFPALVSNMPCSIESVESQVAGFANAGHVNPSLTFAIIRHQRRKTTILGCHICQIPTGVEKMNI
jgi:hypothetical protein